MADRRINYIEKKYLLETGYEVVRKQGFASITARVIAQEGEISTYPLYTTFGNMDGYKAALLVFIREEFLRKAQEKVGTQTPLFDFIRYIMAFSYREPNVFNVLIEESKFMESEELSEWSKELVNDECDAHGFVRGSQGPRLLDDLDVLINYAVGVGSWAKEWETVQKKIEGAKTLYEDMIESLR